MRSIKGWIPTAFLTVAILLGATGANAGIITAGRATTNTCQTTSNSTGVITAGFADGVITAGFTGIITAGFADGVITAGLTGVITAGFKTGIIVTDSAQRSTTSCGIIVTD
jgi:hypothetical protein